MYKYLPFFNYILFYIGIFQNYVIPKLYPRYLINFHFCEMKIGRLYIYYHFFYNLYDEFIEYNLHL